MPAMRLLAVLLFVLAVPLLLGGLVLLGSEEVFVPDVAGDRTLTGGLYGVFGLAFFAIGIVLLMVERGQQRRAGTDAAAAQTAAARPAARQIEIKRTRMDVGEAPTAAPHEGGDTALDAVNRKIARLKVQYGLGEVGRETFRRGMDQLEKEKAEIQLRLMGDEPDAR